jgi:hypothetical protein
MDEERMKRNIRDRVKGTSKLMKENQWIFYGVMLFDVTNDMSLSLLNNTIAIYKSTPENPRTIWIWQ